MKLYGQPFDLMQYIYGYSQKPIIRACIRFNGKLKSESLKRAVKVLSSIYPILRCKYEIKKGIWNEDSISYENLLTTISAKSNFSIFENDSLLSSLEIGIDRPLKIYWICGKKSDSLCIIASHLLCDGRGFEQLLYLLAELYSGKEIETQINTNRSFAQITSKFTMMQKIKILCSKTRAESMDAKLHLPLNEGGRKPRLITKQINLPKLEQYRSCVEGHRPNINDILLAAYMLTLHNMFRWNDITIPCPVDLRRFNINANNSVCNLTGNYYCHVRFSDNSTFEKVCNSISAQMCVQKNSSLCLKEPILLHILYRMLPLSILKEVLSKKISVPMTSYTNLGKIDEARLTFQEASVSDAFIVTAAKLVPYFQLAVSTYKNRCTLSACTYASGKSYDLICSVMNNICNLIEIL